LSADNSLKIRIVQIDIGWISSITERIFFNAKALYKTSTKNSFTHNLGRIFMKIGILQTGFVPEPLMEKHGSYSSMFEQLLDGHGFTFETFVVAEGDFPTSVSSCDGWIVTGSAFGAYEHHAFIPPLEDFIRATYKADVPMAGICFGHQIMAQALGGKVEKFSGGWGVGYTNYEMPDKKRAILAMHQDQVVEKPADANVIASTDFCKNAGLAYRGKAISFQPHPEFTPDYMRDLINYKLDAGTLPKEIGKAALEAIGKDNDSLEVARQLAEFFIAAKAEKAA
jgi:GMP synthase-like glutamine amidotransferase